MIIKFRFAIFYSMIVKPIKYKKIKKNIDPDEKIYN
jgi:hypothetical protein